MSNVSKSNIACATSLNSPRWPLCGKAGDAIDSSLWITTEGTGVPLPLTKTESFKISVGNRFGTISFISDPFD